MRDFFLINSVISFLFVIQLSSNVYCQDDNCLRFQSRIWHGREYVDGRWGKETAVTGFLKIDIDLSKNFISVLNEDKKFLRLDVRKWIVSNEDEHGTMSFFNSDLKDEFKISLHSFNDDSWSLEIKGNDKQIRIFMKQR